MTIREYVVKTLQEPLRKYRTPIQDAIIEIMIEYFENYHISIEKLPSIITPDPVDGRYDIINAIAASYKFTIRPEALIEEQVAILANIAYVYKLRGSVYSIEHMKELYGGNLPEPVNVSIPSYGIFRYCISPYDQTDVYQDGDHYRPGIYDVNIYRYNEDINTLISWMYEELVTSGALIKVINHINSGETNSRDPDCTVSFSGDLEDLYESNLYLTVIDSENRIVALKSVAEFRYTRKVPTDYAVRILKYDNPTDTGILYDIDIEDDSIIVEYGFSPNRVNEPITYNLINESSIIDPTDVYLWVRITKDGSIKSASVDLKDVGENWYIQYAVVDSVYYDWMEWTDQEALNPNSVVFTADPTEAIGLYVKSELIGSEYPLCTYQEIRLYKNPEINGDLLKSSYYSESGEDEYGNIGTLVSTLSLGYPITRSENMTDVLVMILNSEE